MTTRTRSLTRYSRKNNNSRCLIRQQLVRGEPCYLGDSLQRFHRRHVHAVLDVTERGLADTKQLCERRLRQSFPLPVDFQGFHMRESIGITYSRAIGPFDSGFQHALDMAKQVRSVYERAMEALKERFPTQKPTQGKLAQVAGIKQPSVNDWKTGAPGMDTAIRTALALGVCVEWLLTERGPKRPPEGGDPTLALLLSQLDDRQKARLARLAEVLKDE